MRHYVDPFNCLPDPMLPDPIRDIGGNLLGLRDPMSNLLTPLRPMLQNCHIQPLGIVSNALGDPIGRIGPGNSLMPPLDPHHR